MNSMNVCTWNTCKKGRSAVASVARGFKTEIGETLCLLQEIPAWGPLCGFAYHSHTLLSNDGSDSGFLIPRRWMSAVRSQAFGAYWAGCVIGSVIFLSAHILDHNVEGGRAEDAFSGSIQY